MLVILTGEIANERLPLQLKLPLPDGTDVPLGIGHNDTTTNLSPLPEVRESGKRWVDVRMVKQEFQIEFYYNPFSEGNQSISDDRNGDLIVYFEEKEHQLFTRNENDILLDCWVHYPLVVLGGEVMVPTLSGKVKVKIAKGINSGQLLRLKGKGLQSVNSPRRGAY